MKKAALFVSLIFAASALLTGNAIARDTMEQEKSGAAGQSDVQKESQQSQAQSSSKEQQQSIREIKDLKGITVQNAQGEKVGKISEVLVDLQAGQIGYAVVSSGGILGMGEEKYIVPFRALKAGEGDNMILDIPADRLKQAPKGSVEQAFSREQGREIHQFYGVAPYWEESGKKSEQRTPESEKDQQQRSEEQEKKY